MKLFVQKILLFSFLIFLSIKLLKLFVPYYWGNEVLSQKIMAYEEVSKIENVERLFIGSSRVNRQINVELFDNLTKDRLNSFNLAYRPADNKVKSFNFGVNGMFMLESVFLIENMIEDPKFDNIKEIHYVVRNDIRDISDENYHVLRLKYFLDFKSLKRAVKVGFNSSRKISRYVIMYIENQLGIGELKALLHRILNPILSNTEDWEKTRGYKPYSRNTAPTFEYKKLANKFKKRANYSRNKVNFSNKRLSKTEREVIDIYTLLEEKCKENGVELYFIHLPNEKLPHLMKEFNNIYLGDGVSFKEYFQEEYRYDEGHLNYKGADIFTSRLAREYLRLKVE